MRRKDREITDLATVEEIIKNTDVLRLAMFDGDFPYIVPLNFGYELQAETLIFYVHGAPVGHKLDLINANGHVGVELDTDHEIKTGPVEHPEKYSYYYSSIIGRGIAEILTELPDKKHGLACLLAKAAPETDINSVPDAMISRTAVIKVTIPNFTAKQNPKK